MSQQNESTTSETKQETPHKKSKKPLTLPEIKVQLLRATHERLEELHKRKQHTLNEIEEKSYKLGSEDNKWIKGGYQEQVKAKTFSVTEIDKDIAQQTAVLQQLLTDK